MKLLVVASLIAGLLLVIAMTRGRRPLDRSAAEVAHEIESFLQDRGGPYDWDEFTTLPISDPYLDGIRLRCLHLRDEYPPGSEPQYCSAEGLRVLEEMLAEVRERAV